jgi:Aldo/keto reductase family
LLKEVGRRGVLVEGTGLISLDPDADQIARDVVAFLQTVKRIASQKLLNDLTLKLDTVGSILGHELSSFESPACRSNVKPSLSSPRGPLQRTRFYRLDTTYPNPRVFCILDALDGVAASDKAKPAEVVLASVTARPAVTAPIAKATSVEQIESLARAAELTLTEGDMATLTQASVASL